ncbi:MAG: tRNA epoxyqueuosine(34) reductase QueG [Bacteroidetes bacterium]|nr:tRNA epoxyqueuosine(34) reductase QueG [Bacteroidota bacterium]
MGSEISIKKKAADVKKEAERLGFAACGFSRAEALPDHAMRLKEWLGKEYHARMDYMANHFEKRTDPTLLVEGSKSVISLLYNYYTERQQEDPEAPVLSKYAYGRDYHFVLKDKMHLLLEFIRSSFGPAEGRVFVDSAPVLDRAWAVKAGLGWIGRNSNLISRKAGSFVFIGEIILDMELEYNQVPEGDFCGSCTRCIEACPTEAILPNRTLDAQKCISYQTIENKSAIDQELEVKLSNRFFGCDICQDVCPWNRSPLCHNEPEFEPAAGLLKMSRSNWASLEKEQFNHLFKESPLKRAGFSKLKENIASLEKKH